MARAHSESVSVHRPENVTTCQFAVSLEDPDAEGVLQRVRKDGSREPVSLVLFGSILFVYKYGEGPSLQSEPQETYLLEDAVIEAHGLPGGDLYEWASTLPYMLRVARWDYELLFGCPTEMDLQQWFQHLEEARLSHLTSLVRENIAAALPQDSHTSEAVTSDAVVSEASIRELERRVAEEKAKVAEAEKELEDVFEELEKKQRKKGVLGLRKAVREEASTATAHPP